MDSQPYEATEEDQDMDRDHSDYGENEEGEEPFDDEDDDEDDDDEEAEAVAKRLGDALWAEISKAYAQRATEPQVANHHTSSPSPSDHPDDHQNVVDAIRAVLALSASHPSLNATLSSTIVPGTDGQSLSQVLMECTQTRELSASMAKVLGDLVQSIANGEALPTM